MGYVMDEAIKMTSKSSLTIVSTLYNSESHILLFLERILSVDLPESLYLEKIILVDDCSPDESTNRIQGEYGHDSRIKIIKLSRNHGLHTALKIGIGESCSDYTFILDSDLEEDPNWLIPMYEKLSSESADVVFGVQDKRKGKILERWSGDIFWRLIDAASDIPIPRNITNARLMNQRYIAAFKAYTESQIFLGGIFPDVGFKQVGISVAKGFKGRTSFSLTRKLKMAIEAFTSYGSKPLAWAFYFAGVINLLSLFSLIFLFVLWLVSNNLVPGWLTLIALVIWFGSVNLLMTAILGLFVSKIYLETKRRPVSFSEL